MTTLSSAVPALKVRIIAWTLAGLVCLALLEGGARLVLGLRDSMPSYVPVQESLLNEYQMRDTKLPWLWRLKTGYKKTIQELIDEKRAAGRTLGAESLERWVKELNLGPGSPAMEINAQGLKGPPLDPVNFPFRVLTIGDSCTFGTAIDYESYPRALERGLRAGSMPVEVANAGVEGYSPRHVLARMDELKGLKPKVTVIYVGWNALYSEDIYSQLQPIAVVRLARKAYRRLIPSKALNYTPAGGGQDRHRRSGAVANAGRAKFTFMADVEKIVREMQGSGSRVVLATIPGLFRMDEVPSRRALEIGHLPDFTDNPFVLAVLAENYNAQLRELASRTGADLIDLEAWSKQALQPLDQNFFDSVHLEPRSQTKLGEHLAAEMIRRKIVH
jgi:hypothetical protein